MGPTILRAFLFLEEPNKGFQFRGLLELAKRAWRDGALCKSMVISNPALQGEALVLQHCTVKVRGPALANQSSYAFDITAGTRPMAQPRLTPSALEARVKLLDNKREQDEVASKRHAFVQKCKSITWEGFGHRTSNFF
eukprot:s58_g34.t1